MQIASNVSVWVVVDESHSSVIFGGVDGVLLGVVDSVGLELGGLQTFNCLTLQL